MEKFLRDEMYKFLEGNLDYSTNALIAKEILYCLNFEQPLNSSEIAKKCFTSRPSVTRFAQSFGFLGFKEFSRELLKQEQIYFFSSKVKQYHDSFKDYSCSLKNYVDILNRDEATLINLAAMIEKKQRILIFASPENIEAASFFAGRLIFLGISVFDNLRSKHLTGLNNFQDDDIVLFLVSGFDNSTLVQIWDYLKTTNATKFLFTSESQRYKFSDPNYLIDLNIGQNLLREQLKPFLFTYLLDQVCNLLVYNDKDYVNALTHPKFRL